MRSKKTLPLAFLMMSLTVSADADWINDSISPHCSEEARDRIAAATRQQIESSVRRAEAAIEPPAATGDLSCLEGLMRLPIDKFAPTGELKGLFAGSLDSTIGNGNRVRPLCSFAERKWRDVTRPITFPLDILQKGLPPNLTNRFNLVNRFRPAINGPTGKDHPPSSTSPPERHRTSNSPSTTHQFTQPNPTIEQPSRTVEEIWKSLYGAGTSQ